VRRDVQFIISPGISPTFPSFLERSRHPFPKRKKKKKTLFEKPHRPRLTLFLVIHPTQVARVLLERSPYVPFMTAQRPAFLHPAFNGVVHPDLPVWAGETGPSAPPEPAPESESAKPRVARLSNTESETLPDFHVQTLSGSQCRSTEGVRFKIRSASVGLYELNAADP
jgi:hypothetical protein